VNTRRSNRDFTHHPVPARRTTDGLPLKGASSACQEADASKIEDQPGRDNGVYWEVIYIPGVAASAEKGGGYDGWINVEWKPLDTCSGLSPRVAFPAIAATGIWSRSDGKRLNMSPLSPSLCGLHP